MSIDHWSADLTIFQRWGRSVMGGGFGQVMGVAILTSMSLFGTGCTSLRSSSEPVGEKSFASDNKARVGLYYFLPKALVTIEGREAADVKQVFQVTVARKMVADRRHRYQVRWTQNPFYDDTVESADKSDGIVINDQGLLTRASVATTDQTPGIASDLANTAVNVFRILGRVGGTGAQSGRLQGAKKDLSPFKFTFDPLDAGEVQQVESALREFGILVNICPDPSVTQSCIGASIAVADSKKPAPGEADVDKDRVRSGGVFYHPPTAVEMRFDFKGANVIHRETIMVPDPERVACFRFGRSPLVKRETRLTMVDGMPTGFRVDRPSPLRAGTTMLKDVSGIIANAIPTIVNVKVNRELSELSAANRLSKAESDLAAQRKTELTNEKALADAMAAAAAAGGAQSGRLDPRAGEDSFKPSGGAPQRGAQRGDLLPPDAVPLPIEPVPKKQE